MQEFLAAMMMLGVGCSEVVVKEQRVKTLHMGFKEIRRGQYTFGCDEMR